VSTPIVGLRPGRLAPRQEGEPQPQRDAIGEPSSIGILGGTFDPPHVGHLWLATLAADALGLDHVLLLPAGQPPHKIDHQLSSAADRLLMTRLAIVGDPRLRLSAIEIDRAGPSYTVDSVDELRRTLGDDVRLVLVMATDSLAALGTWHEPERLLSLVELAVGPRTGTPAPSPEVLRERWGEAAGRIRLLEGPSLDVSSSEIRRRVAAGKAIRYLVPRAVEEHIHERGLYRSMSA